MEKVKVQSSTLRKVIRGLNGASPTLSLITKCVNSLRYTKYNGTSKEPLSLEEVKVSLEHYKISYIDDTITNKPETNSNQTNKYKSLFFAQMKDNEADLLFNADCEIIIPVKINDYTREIHNYMMKLPYEYFEDNPKIICNKLNITVTKGGSLMEFNYKFLLDYSSNMGLF